MSEAAPQTKPADFLRVFSVADSTGQPALVAGGHAVNLWALHYVSHEPALSDLGPFVSKDLDLLADQETVWQLSQLLRQQPVRPPKGDPNPVLARFEFATPSGTNTSIEVLFTVYGADPKKLKSSSVIVESQALGLRIRLPDLVSLLESKIHNVLGLDQRRRQDLKHVRVLVLCNRAFARDSLQAAEDGKISERSLINGMEALFRVVRSEVATQAGLSFNIDWSSAFPVPELSSSHLPRVQRFLERRLQPAFPQIGRRP